MKAIIRHTCTKGHICRLNNDPVIGNGKVIRVIGKEDVEGKELSVIVPGYATSKKDSKTWILKNCVILKDINEFI